MNVGDEVFVYGTLRKGGKWHKPFTDRGVTFIGQDELKGTMYDYSKNIPFLSLEGGHTIRGEVYVLDTVAVIDFLNMLESGYSCKQVTLGSGRQAWVFFADKVMDLPIVETGDWLEHIKAA